VFAFFEFSSFLLVCTFWVRGGDHRVHIHLVTDTVVLTSIIRERAERRRQQAHAHTQHILYAHKIYSLTYSLKSIICERAERAATGMHITHVT
jgi:hypothetical protein